MKLFDATLSTLEHALDARLDRQNALAGDIANAATPGYVPADVDVEARIAEAGKTDIVPPTAVASEEGYIALGSAPAARPGSTIAGPLGSPGLDGNRVDLDRTLAALAQNALQYGAAAKAASKKLAILSYVASDGGG